MPRPIIAMLLEYWHDTFTEPDRARPVTRSPQGPGARSNNGLATTAPHS